MSLVKTLDYKEVFNLRKETGMGLAEAVRIKKIEALEDAINIFSMTAEDKDLVDILKAMFDLVKRS